MWVSAVGAQEPPLPLVTVGPMVGPVTIDGEIGPEEWAGASGVGAFTRLGGDLAQSPAECLVGYDAEGLLVAWRLQGKPRVRARGRDGEVWRDDDVEVFVQPSGADSYRHFALGASGDMLDEMERDASWDADWQAAVRVRDDGWDAEMRIPFAVWGAAPQAGDVWRVSFARHATTPEEYATWAPVQRSFHEPQRFGELRFAAQPAGCSVVGVRRTDDRRMLVDGRACGRARLSAELLAGATAVAAATTETNELLELSIPRPGRYMLRLAGVGADGVEVLRQEVPVYVKPPIELTLRKGLLAAMRVIVGIDAEEADGVPESYRISINGEPVATVPADPDAPRRARATVSLVGVEPGEVTLAVEALAAGEVIAREEASFELPPQPDYVGSDIGVSDELPAPWTPVQTDGDAVRCWGREYAFDGQALPARIITADAQVLAAPMRLVAVAGGRHQLWRDARLAWGERSPTAAQGIVTARAESATLECAVRCEFDGMMRFDLAVTPVEGQAIEELVLEVPLRAEHAKYLHAADASWGGSVSGALPDEGWEHRFMPFVWLGDEQRGLQWFAESDETWRPADPARAITIERGEGVAMLRLHLIEEALAAGEAFRATFGLQATPVRPPDPAMREWHITHGAFYGMQDQTASSSAYLAYPAEGNISLDAGTVEMWVKPLFDPAVEVMPATRGSYNRELFRLVLDNGDHVGFYWNIDDRNLRLYSRIGGEVVLYTVVGRTEPWEQGSWHRVGFTWGEEAAIWIDGEKRAAKPWGRLIEGTLEGARIIIGSPPAATPCDFAVDELRISEVARDLTRAPVPGQTDEHTLLYDGFDEGVDAPGPGGRSVSNRDQITGTEGVSGAAVAIGDPNLNLLDALKAQGVNTLVYHESWTEIQAYGSTQIHEQELRDLVAACHERDIKLLLYFGYELSDAAPEWDAYSDEVLVWPRRGGYRRRDIPQTAYICCYESAWKEYVLTGIARMIDEYDIDGVYLDGTTEPFACANDLHGCGYQAADGTRHRTYPIFAVRDLMRRMRRIVKSRKPDGLISAHMSATVSIPTLAFVDDYWDGEQLDVQEHGFRLPLDAFRAEFMGHNWGVPAELLCYYRKPFTYEEAIALGLLHDVPVRPYVRGGLLPMMSSVWAAWDVIDINAATWYPYWTDGPVTTEAANVLISTHVGPGGALIVAMNAGAEPVQADLLAPPAALGLQTDTPVARNVLTRRDVDYTDGRLAVALEPWEAAVLLVTAREP